MPIKPFLQGEAVLPGFFGLGEDGCWAPAGPLPCAQVLAGLGGRRTVRWRLRGRLLFSWHYTGRLEDVEKTHAENPLALAYQVGPTASLACLCV